MESAWHTFSKAIENCAKSFETSGASRLTVVQLFGTAAETALTPRGETTLTSRGGPKSRKRPQRRVRVMAMVAQPRVDGCVKVGRQLSYAVLSNCNLSVGILSGLQLQGCRSL